MITYIHNLITCKPASTLRAMANKKCHEGPCTQCTLCMKSNSKYTHPAQVRADKSTYDKLREFKPDVEDTACICLPCARQLKRFATNPNLKAHPRWLPKSENATEKKKCSVENCKLYVYRSTNLASIENLEHLLGKRIVAFSIDQRSTVQRQQLPRKSKDSSLNSSYQ